MKLQEESRENLLLEKRLTKLLDHLKKQKFTFAKMKDNAEDSQEEIEFLQNEKQALLDEITLLNNQKKTLKESIEKKLKLSEEKQVSLNNEIKNLSSILLQLREENAYLKEHI